MIRGCLHLKTLTQRQADLENDQEYIKLAKSYWISHGEIYNLYNDDLWIKTDWWLTYWLETAKNTYYLPEDKKTARFPLEDNLYEIWKNLEENKENYKRAYGY